LTKVKEKLNDDTKSPCVLDGKELKIIWYYDWSCCL